MEAFPGDTLRVYGPVLIRPGITAGGIGLILYRQAGGCKALFHFRQFLIGFHLNPKVIDTGLGNRCAQGRYGKINLRFFKRPLRVVGPEDSRFGCKERRVVADAGGKIGYGDMDMKAFHNDESEVTLQLLIGRHGLPPQQFSVR